MIWDLFEDGNLFTGQDPEHQRYRSRAHIAEIIALLGQPPQPLLSLGKSSHKFFTETGDFRADIPVPNSISLEERETTLQGESEKRFDVSRHDAEDAPVGAIEAFLSQSTGRRHMD